jgi:hypothetical protein
VEELTARPYRTVDAAEVAELLNLIAEHAGGHRWATADLVAAYLATEVRDWERDSRLLSAADGALMAAALVSSPPEDGWRVDLNGGVHERVGFTVESHSVTYAKPLSPDHHDGPD